MTSSHDDCRADPAEGAAPSFSVGAPDLPTRQKNALRLLLAKPVITPQEVASLDYRVLLRAPGIGKKSLELIRTWLQANGCAPPEPMGLRSEARLVRRRSKLERAIDTLRWHGYEVRRPR